MTGMFLCRTSWRLYHQNGPLICIIQGYPADHDYLGLFPLIVELATYKKWESISIKISRPYLNCGRMAFLRVYLTIMIDELDKLLVIGHWDSLLIFIVILIFWYVTCNIMFRICECFPNYSCTVIFLKINNFQTAANWIALLQIITTIDMRKVLSR